MLSNENIVKRRGQTVSLFLFLTRFCEREAEAERDVFFWEKYLELAHHAGAGAEALPRRRSDARTANSLNSASFWISRSTWRTSVVGRIAWMVSTWTSSCPKNKVLRSDSDVVCVQVRRPKKTGTMLQLYFSDAFFSYPTIELRSRSRQCLQCPAPHVEGVVQARKKKCGFMVWCRERPAWWGALVKSWSRRPTLSSRFVSQGINSWRSWRSWHYCSVMSVKKVLTKILRPLRREVTFSFLRPNINPLPFHAPYFPFLFIDIIQRASNNTIEIQTKD